MQRLIAELVREEIKSYLPSLDSSTIPHEVAVEFVVVTIWSLLTWWMDNNMPGTAVDIDRMFHTLVLSGIDGVRRRK